MDGDVAYLLGLLVARGSLVDTGDTKRIVLHFPYSSLKLTSETQQFDQETEIRLGLETIKTRLQALLDCNFEQNVLTEGVDLIAKFFHSNMMWRNLHLILDDATSYRTMHIPEVMLDSDTPRDWKREFARGYADVAGNIRSANLYVDGRNRVRLDILNYKTNWQVPVELCTLIQVHLGVPVQLITWGHPNMGREWREHQLNIFAAAFRPIGFSFRHKQALLEEFANKDIADNPAAKYTFCPGERPRRGRKPRHPEEQNREKLDERLVGKHSNAYWEICRKLGCPRRPSDEDIEQLEMEDVFELNNDAV